MGEKMNNKRVSKTETFNLKKISLVSLFIYVLLVFIFWLIASEQLTYKESSNNIKSVESNTPIGEITSDIYVEQGFVSPVQVIDNISLKFATYGRENTCSIRVSLIDALSNSVIESWNIEGSSLKDNEFVELWLNKPLFDTYNNRYTIRIESDNAYPGNSVTLWYNNEKISNEGMDLFVNDTDIYGTLCFEVKGRDVIWFGQHYFLMATLFGLVMTLYLIIINKRQSNNQQFIGLNMINSFIKYRFLLKQLVARDFKTKYKRSVLGALWSFLNPLLTMVVQYIVFSTIFKSDINNFPVYLITGIILYSFFIESVGMGLSSITNNAALITKVYVPKYIYPFSRVLSSCINLVISMVPLFLVILITRTPVRPSILLIPFSIFCIFVFCLGMALILSSAMVFFRDTQFLWNVVSMLWMYLTPIFYPESIIPAKYITLYKLNPLYHFIRFSRTVILDGVSPEPQAYFYCLIAAFGTLIVGALIFKKTQNKFILYI